MEEEKLSEGKKDDKFSRETAEAEFVSYCEANDIDCNELDMDEEDRKNFLPIKKRFIKACRQGRVLVNDTKLEYTITKLSPFDASGKVTINRPTGQAFMGMDGFKEQQSVHKLQGFVSAMTGKEVAYFSKIDIEDWMFFRNIATLFLSA
jgi:hypothetical protein